MRPADILPKSRNPRQPNDNSDDWQKVARRETDWQTSGGWMTVEAIDLAEKFGLFSEHWRPKVMAELNGQEVKLVKVRGTFPWHLHADADEMFLVWRGRFRVEFRDRVVTLNAGQCVVVPRGVEHRTAADEEADVLIFEPAETRNTGNVDDATFTAPQAVRI